MCGSKENPSVEDEKIYNINEDRKLTDRINGGHENTRNYENKGVQSKP